MLLALLLAMPVAQAFACSIIVDEKDAHLYTNAAYFERARNVAVVRVDLIERRPTGKGDSRTVTFSRLQDLKGQLPATFVRDIGVDLGCGPSYFEGEQLVLFIEPQRKSKDFINHTHTLVPGTPAADAYVAELQQLSH